MIGVSCAMLTGARLNVSTDPPDPELETIQHEIKDVHLVGDRMALEQLLVRLAEQRQARFETLDLIGHSDGRDRQLRLGRWLVADNAETDLFITSVKPVLAHLGIRQLRLLGCYTACRPGGQATMRRLSRGLGFNVFGTYGVLNQ